MDYIVGFRCKDLPEPYVESLKKKCEGCSENIWISKKLSKRLNQDDLYLCLQCAGKTDDHEIMIHSETIKEVKEYFEKAVV